jgi:hypothetical protein
MENSGANRPKESRFREEIALCRRTDRGHSERVGGRREDAGALPEAWHQLGNVLRVEVEVRRHGGQATWPKCVRSKTKTDG